MADERAAPAWDRLQALREVQAHAQAGLTYAENEFDRHRYTRLRELAADLIADAVHGPPGAVRDAVLGQVGYLTPKVDVRAAVFDPHDRVLLVLERESGAWTLPGGWADVNESVAQGAEREVREESGYLVQASRLFGVYERDRWGHVPFVASILKVVVGADLVGGTPTASVETADVGFFAAEDLPRLDVGRTSPALLARVFALHADPHLGPDMA